MCRRKLDLPDKYLIIFNAARIDNPIKGFDILLKAIGVLIDKKYFRAEELHLVLVGKIKYPHQVLPSIPVDFTEMGWCTSETLSQLYSAADVTVSASYYETFGQTLIEAQACGCLPVSFGNSGQTDIIQHKENGYIAEYLSPESLAEGIHWSVFEGRKKLSRESLRRSVIKRFSPEVVARQYVELYARAIEKTKNNSMRNLNQKTI